MYHRKAFINFQQNRVDRSIKTVHTNIFAKQRKCDRQHICGSQHHAISKLPSMVEVGYKIWGGGAQYRTLRHTADNVNNMSDIL